MNKNLNIIDITKHKNFERLFERFDTDGIETLSELLSVYLEVPVENLVIKSLEIAPGAENSKNVGFYVHCTFEKGGKVDVEIEKIHRRFETVPKMIIDLKNLSGQKVRVGKDYIADTGIYLAFIYDCIKYEDELPIHTFIFKTEEGIELLEKDYVKWITVEIPKIRENQ